MVCMHVLGNSVMDDVICDIHFSNQIVIVYLLNGHEPNSNHRPLTLILNCAMHKSHMYENCENQKYMLFDENKMGLVLKDLNRDLCLLTIIMLQPSLLPLESSLSRCHIKRIIKLPTLSMITILKVL